MAGLKFDITGDNSNMLSALQGTQNGVRQTQKVVEESGQSIEQMFGRIQTAAAASLGAFSAKEFASKVMSIRGEFQQLEVAFSTMLGSASEANALMNQLVRTAATTPFDLKGVADGAKQLLAYGTSAKDVNETLVRLGDIAAGLSIPLGDLVYLYGTTMVQGRMFTMDLRQFQGRGVPLAEELAKQFGVAKEEVAGLVTQGKVSAEIFNKAIVSMTSSGGKFAGLMENQSHTITGQISNIEDAIDMMFNDIGKESEGIINKGLEVTSFLVEHWRQVGEAIMAAVGTIGLYKAALGTVAVVNKLTTSYQYQVEAAELQKLVAVKEENVNVDLQSAVASGRLSAAKAQEIASMRLEIQSKLQAAQAALAQAQAEELSARKSSIAATQRFLTAKQNLAVAQSQVTIAVKSGTVEEIEIAKKSAHTAAEELNTAAVARNNASKNLSMATSARRAAVQSVETLQIGVNTAAQNANAVSTGFLAAAKQKLTVALTALNSTMLASQWFWATAAVIGLVYATYKLVTAETVEEAARRKANNAMDEFNQKVDRQRQKVQELIGVVQSSTATELQKADAYAQLKTLVPSLTEKYSQQAIAQADVNKANKEFNEQADQMKYDEIQKNISGTIEKLDSLKKELESYSQQPQNTGTATAMAMTSREIDKQQALLEQYYLQLTQYNTAKQQALENSKPLEIRIEEASENEKVRQSVFDFYERAVKVAQSAADNTSYIMRDAGQNSANALDNLIDELSQKIEKMKEDERKNPLVIHPELQGMQAALNDLISMKSEWKSTGQTTIPLFFRLNYQSAQQSLQEAKSKAQSLISQHPSADNNLKNDREAARKKYNEDKAFLDKINKNQSKYTKEQYKEAENNLKASKQAYEDLGGKIDKSSKKSAEKAANDRMQAARDHAKYVELLKKQKEEKEKTERDLEFSTREAILKAREESSEKTVEQLALDRDKQIEEIERNYKEIKQKKIESARQMFEANPANKKRVFKYDENDKQFSYTEKEQENYKANKAAAEAEYTKGIKEQLQSETQLLREYLKEYGSLQEQKAAINEEYNQKIAKADNTYLKAKLSAERDKMLNELDFKSLQESINWEDVFNSVEHHSTKYLKAIKEKLREALNAKDITAENAKVLADKIREIETTIGNRTDVWSAILPGLRERKKLTEETALAQDALNKAVAEQANANFKVFTDKMNIQEKLKTAGVEAELADINEKNMDTLLSSLDKGTPLYNGLLELFKNLSVDNSIANKKTQEVSQSRNRLNSQWDKLKNMNSLTDIFGDIGGNPLAIADTANKNIQSAKELVTTLGMENTDFGVAVGKFADGSNEMMNAVNALTSGDVLGAINHTIRGFQSWVDIFRGGSNHERQLAIQEDISKKMDILNASITKLTDKLEKSYGAEAIKTKEELDKKISGNQKYYWQGLEAAGVDNYGKGHSDWYHWNKNSAGTARDIAREYGMGNVKSWQDLFSQLAGMKDGGGAKILEDIRTNHALDWWYTMQTQGYNDGKMGEWLTKWADSWKTIEDAQEKLKEQLTGTTEDNVFSDFMNSLNDLANGSEDVFENIADNWQKMVNKMVLNNLVGSKYQKQLKDWYEKFSNAYNDKNIDKKELSDLKDEYNKIAQAAKDDITRLKENGLISDSNNQSQKATANGISSITYEQTNNFIALTTAGNISRDQIKELISSVVVNISSMTDFSSSTNTAILEIRNLMIYNNSYLEDILKCSKSIYADFSRKIDDINKNLKDLK